MKWRERFKILEGKLTVKKGILIYIQEEEEEGKK